MKYQTLKEAIKGVLLGEENLYEAEAATLQKLGDMAVAKVEAILKKKGYMDKKEKGVLFINNNFKENKAEICIKFTPLFDTRTKQALMRAGTDITKAMEEFLKKFEKVPFLKDHRLSPEWINIYRNEAGIEKYLKTLDNNGKATLPIVNIYELDPSLADTQSKEYYKNRRAKEAPEVAQDNLRKTLDRLNALFGNTGKGDSDWRGDNIFHDENLDAIGRYDVKFKKDLIELKKIVDRIRKEHAGKKFN